MVQVSPAISWVLILHHIYSRFADSSVLCRRVDLCTYSSRDDLFEVQDHFGRWNLDRIDATGSLEEGNTLLTVSFWC